MNDEFVNFQKSYSLDPFPVPTCQVKKRITDKFRKRRDSRIVHAAEPIVKTIDCNGSIASRIQRSDHHTPLLVNTKRWHSLELTVRGDAEHDESSSGCEELIDNNKNKSLGRSILKSWLVGIFQGGKNPPANGNNNEQSNAIVCPKKPDRESIV